MHFRRWVGLVLAVMVHCAALGTAVAQDSPGVRPSISHNTVYSARGTLLRGTPISTEGNAPGEFLMTHEEMAALQQNGLNALRISAERRSDAKPIGASAKNCDALIDLAGEMGMTVLLTVGEFRLEGGDIAGESQFVHDFWRFYAGRYGDKPHVIFDICNEVPTAPGTAEMNAEAYRIIRERAPNTLVLFNSYAVTDQLDTILPHVEAMEALIDDEGLWENAALAFHGYECQEDLRGAAGFRAVIHALTRRGYPLINTEVPNRFELSPYPDTSLLRVLEEEEISWISFVFWERIDTPSLWRGPMEAAGVTWRPDFGEWPVVDALHPFSRQSIWESADSTPVGFVKEHRFTAYGMRDGDFLTLSRVNFGSRQPLALRVTAKGEGLGALTLCSGDAALARIPVFDTMGEYATFDGWIEAPIAGVADLRLEYTSQEEGSLYIGYWQFTLPDQREHSDPYNNAVSAASYAYSEGGVRRGLCDEPDFAGLQVQNIRRGDAITFDFVGFRDEDAQLSVRAMAVEGGVMRVFAGDHGRERYELGQCHIDGEKGVWAEYRCPIDRDAILMFDPVVQYWDLWFEFDGESDGELFRLSEFTFLPD